MFTFLTFGDATFALFEYSKISPEKTTSESPDETAANDVSILDASPDLVASLDSGESLNLSLESVNDPSADETAHESVFDASPDLVASLDLVGYFDPSLESVNNPAFVESSNETAHESVFDASPDLVPSLDLVGYFDPSLESVNNPAFVESSNEIAHESPPDLVPSLDLAEYLDPSLESVNNPAFVESSNETAHDLATEMIKIGCTNKRVRDMFREPTNQFIQELIKANSFCDVTNKYTRTKIRPLKVYRSQHQIYGVFKTKNSCDLEKVGYSGNTRDRYGSDQTAILVSQRTISPELDRKLIKIVDKLLKDFWEDTSLPYDFRRLCYTILYQGAAALGVKRHVYMQLIEIGCQDRYHLPAPAEVFNTGEQVQLSRRLKVQETFETWVAKDDLKKFVGRPIKMVDTWKTGQRKDRLSSQVCANDFVASGVAWVDAIDAVFENAIGPDKIFCTDWKEHEIEEGREHVFGWIRWTIENSAVLLLAKNQEKHFPDDKLLKLLQRNFNFKVTFLINNRRIVSLTHVRGNAKVILYCPLGFAMDTRCDIEDLSLQLRTFLEMGALRLIVCLLCWKEIPSNTSPSEDNAITAAFFFEAIQNFFHSHRFIAAAVARDALTPDDVRACKQNGLQKADPAHNGHISTRARRLTWYEPTERPLEMNIVHKAANLLSMTNEARLEYDLIRIHQHFCAPERNGDVPTSKVIGTRWKSLFERHIIDDDFREKCQTFVEENLKRNTGNRNAYKATDLKTNDEVMKLLWKGKKFLIQQKTPEEDMPAKLFDASQSKLRLFETHFYVHQYWFVFNGVKERVNTRKRKGNTNHQQGIKLQGKRKLKTLCKYHVFLDGSNREPIPVRANGPNKGPHGSTTFCLCQLVSDSK